MNCDQKYCVIILNHLAEKTNNELQISNKFLKEELSLRNKYFWANHWHNFRNLKSNLTFMVPDLV